MKNLTPEQMDAVAQDASVELNELFSNPVAEDEPSAEDLMNWFECWFQSGAGHKRLGRLMRKKLKEIKGE
jgi:hypothetical protein